MCIEAPLIQRMSSMECFPYSACRRRQRADAALGKQMRKRARVVAMEKDEEDRSTLKPLSDDVLGHCLEYLSGGEWYVVLQISQRMRREVGDVVSYYFTMREPSVDWINVDVVCPLRPEMGIIRKYVEWCAAMSGAVQIYREKIECCLRPPLWPPASPEVCAVASLTESVGRRVVTALDAMDFDFRCVLMPGVLREYRALPYFLLGGGRFGEFRLRRTLECDRAELDGETEEGVVGTVPAWRFRTLKRGHGSEEEYFTDAWPLCSRWVFDLERQRRGGEEEEQ